MVDWPLVTRVTEVKSTLVISLVFMNELLVQIRWLPSLFRLKGLLWGAPRRPSLMMLAPDSSTGTEGFSASLGLANEDIFGLL